MSAPKKSLATTQVAEVAPSPSEELQDEALAEVDLAGAPALRPVGTYRMRERAKLFQEVQRISDAFNGDEDEKGDELDLSKLDLVADIDEFLESAAVHPEIYAEWATEDGGGPDVEQRITALFSRFASDLGKSGGSAS